MQERGETVFCLELNILFKFFILFFDWNKKLSLLFLSWGFLFKDKDLLSSFSTLIIFIELFLLFLKSLNPFFIGIFIFLILKLFILLNVEEKILLLVLFVFLLFSIWIMSFLGELKLIIFLFLQLRVLG